MYTCLCNLVPVLYSGKNKLRNSKRNNNNLKKKECRRRGLGRGWKKAPSAMPLIHSGEQRGDEEIPLGSTENSLKVMHG